MHEYVRSVCLGSFCTSAPRQYRLMWLCLYSSVFPILYFLCWVDTSTRMKPRYTVSPRCTCIDSTINKRHLMRTCSCAVWPDPMVVCPSKLVLYISVQDNNLGSYTVASCAHICSNAEWKSHHTTLHWRGTVPLRSCSGVFPALDCILFRQTLKTFKTDCVYFLNRFYILFRQTSCTFCGS